jgi:hypothetical protein
MLILIGSVFGLFVAVAMVLATLIALGFIRGEEVADGHRLQAREPEPPSEIIPGVIGLRSSGQPKPGWLSKAILSGFIASIAMLFAFAVAYAAALTLAGAMTGDQDTASRTGMARWLFNLTHNPVTDLAQSSLYFSVGAHITLGLVFAVIYGFWAEPRMWGPHWARGVVFATLPWLFSVLLFLPATGGGFLGLALGAGPLPFLGNLALHAVFGAVLGVMYGPWGDIMPAVEESRTPEHYRAMGVAEGLAAKGVLVGLLLGLVAGALGGSFLEPRLPDLTAGPPQLSILGLALMGGALGALVGSLLGLPEGEPAGP